MRAAPIATDGESGSMYGAGTGGRYNMTRATLLGRGRDARSFFGEERN